MENTINYNREDTAKQVAAHLLRIEAIKLRPNDPFTWASGWKSPIYCDNRLALSFPSVRSFICARMVEVIKSEFKNVEVIAGVATGAIAIGVLVADALNLPFVYVRPEAKSHGRKNQIEGTFEEGKRVLVIEDLISTGKSSLLAVEALRAAQADIIGMLAIFTYGFDQAASNMSKANCQLTTLSTYSYLIAEAEKQGYVSAEAMDTLANWRKSPDTWVG